MSQVGERNLPIWFCSDTTDTTNDTTSHCHFLRNWITVLIRMHLPYLWYEPSLITHTPMSTCLCSWLSHIRAYSIFWGEEAVHILEFCCRAWIDENPETFFSPHKCLTVTLLLWLSLHQAPVSKPASAEEEASDVSLKNSVLYICQIIELGKPPGFHFLFFFKKPWGGSCPFFPV